MARTSGWMRPSKLRLPDSTAPTTRSFSSIAAVISSAQRARVADAGGAAVADQVEAERLQVRGQAGALQVVGHHREPGARLVLTQGLTLEAALDGLAGQQAGGDHDRRVGGVGAAGDGGDDDPAVVELELVPSPSVTATSRTPPGRGGAGTARGAALSSGLAGGSRSGALGDRLVVALPIRPRPRGRTRRSASRKASLASASGTRSWGRFGAGEAGLDGAEVELEQVGEGRLRSLASWNSPCSGRRLDQLDLLGRAAGEGQVAQRLVVDREDRAGRAVLGRHVADRRPVGERAGSPGPAPKNSTNLPTTPRLRSISVTVSTRSVAVAPSGSSPSSWKPTTCGSSIEIGWPSIAASASMPPTPQPSTPRPLIIVVWESVPDQRVGVGAQAAVAISRLIDDLGEVLEVDLVADAGRRRHDAEVVEGLLAPAQERVALAVALELELGVDGEGARGAEGVDLDRVVDHQVRRRPAG